MFFLKKSHVGSSRRRSTDTCIRNYVCAFVVFGTRAHFGTRVVWVPMNALPAMASLGRVAIGSRPPRNSHTPRAARTAVRASVTPDPVDVETAIFGLG